MFSVSESRGLIVFVLVIWCADYGLFDQESLGLPIPHIDDTLDGLRLFEAEVPEAWQVDGSHPIRTQPFLKNPPQPPNQSYIPPGPGLFRRDSDLSAYWQPSDPHVTDQNSLKRLLEMYTWPNPGEWEGSSS